MKRILAAVLLPIVLIGMLSISAFAENPQFDDVPAGAWYADAVRYASEHGLMLGVGGRLFCARDGYDARYGYYHALALRRERPNR